MNQENLWYVCNSCEYAEPKIGTSLSMSEFTIECQMCEAGVLRPTMDSLTSFVEAWAENRGLFDEVNGTNYQAQSAKLLEELGELMTAIRKGNAPEINDGFGDVLVVLIIMNALVDKVKRIPHVERLTNRDLVYMLFGSVLEIAPRQGKMIDGIFVKQADLILSSKNSCACCHTHVLDTPDKKLVYDDLTHQGNVCLSCKQISDRLKADLSSKDELNKRLSKDHNHRYENTVKRGNNEKQ